MADIGDLIYASVEPEAKKNAYSEFDNVDFVINVGEGRVLAKNSVRILGDLNVYSTGTTDATIDVYLDNRVGAHALIESIQVRFSQGEKAGTVENLQNYPRWVSMVEVATKDINDYGNASNRVELKCHNYEQAERDCLQRTSLNATGANLTHNADFSIKPVCVLNKMEGDNLPFNKTGAIRVSINLSKNLAALQGGLAGSVVNYSIENLRLNYNTMIAPKKKTQTLMRSVYNYKSSVLSALSNISARVPAICDAVSISYQRQDRENVNCFSNVKCEDLRTFKKIQYLFNDSTNQYISYVIEDLEEALDRGIDSFVETGHNMMKGEGYKNSNANGIMGLNFNGFIDLTNQRFGVQLTTDVNATNPYNIYLYFHSLMSI